MTTQEIAKKVIADIETKAESERYELIPNEVIQVIKSEYGYYDITVFEKGTDNLIGSFGTDDTTTENLISALDFIIKSKTFKTGKMVLITSDEEIKVVEYSGLKSMQKAVNGYIEMVGTVDMFGIDIDSFCNEEFLIQESDECKKVNAITSLIAKHRIMGNTIFIANEYAFGNSYTRGLNDEEVDKIVKRFNDIKANNKDTIKLLHTVHDMI